MATQEIAKLSSGALRKRYASLKGRIARQNSQGQELKAKIYQSLGTVTAGGTAAALGFAEVRYASKDGKPLSLGALPASLAGSLVLTGVALVWNPGGQTSAAAQGAAGSFGGQWGREAAIKSAQRKAQKVQGVQFDEVGDEDDYE